MTPDKPAWGVKRPDGTLIQVAGASEAQAVFVAGQADPDVATVVRTSDLWSRATKVTRAGYRLVRVRVVEVDDER